MFRLFEDYFRCRLLVLPDCKTGLFIQTDANNSWQAIKNHSHVHGAERKIIDSKRILQCLCVEALLADNSECCLKSQKFMAPYERLNVHASCHCLIRASKIKSDVRFKICEFCNAQGRNQMKIPEVLILKKYL